MCEVKMKLPNGDEDLWKLKRDPKRFPDNLYPTTPDREMTVLLQLKTYRNLPRTADPEEMRRDNEGVVHHVENIPICRLEIRIDCKSIYWLYKDESSVPVDDQVCNFVTFHWDANLEVEY
jgi:hypothetical protein